jgi:hypothetical protein
MLGKCAIQLANLVISIIVGEEIIVMELALIPVPTVVMIIFHVCKTRLNLRPASVRLATQQIFVKAQTLVIGTVCPCIATLAAVPVVTRALLPILPISAVAPVAAAVGPVLGIRPF